jgi:3-deoxy-D-manno-octulosonate 8-phosphate phosphatase (KDO 8-P phosphatase)
VADEEVACMGDDVPDLVLLSRVGLSAAPKTAVAEVRRSVDYVTFLEGGHGAAREFVDLILRAQKKTE